MTIVKVYRCPVCNTEMVDVIVESGYLQAQESWVVLLVCPNVSSHKFPEEH